MVSIKMSHPAVGHVYGEDEMPGLPDLDADGEMIEPEEEVCVGCKGDGYYWIEQFDFGNLEWVKHECLCKKIERMESIANERKDE